MAETTIYCEHEQKKWEAWERGYLNIWLRYSSDSRGHLSRIRSHVTCHYQTMTTPETTGHYSLYSDVATVVTKKEKFITRYLRGSQCCF